MPLLERHLSQSDDDAVRALAGAAEDLPPPEHAESFGAAFASFGEADVVLLGECTHGTGEFYRARAAISRFLIQDFGFNIVAVEADWPDAAGIDRYVRHAPPPGSPRRAFSRFPEWMWRNAEFAEFVQWLHAYNAQRKAEARVEFRGLDVYSLSASMTAVLSYLDREDPNAAKEARRRYACLSPWQDEPADYGRQALAGGRNCEEEVNRQLLELLKRRLDDAMHDGEALFDAVQNARIVRAAESYYRVMYRGSRESWNLRDRHMFETLDRLRRHRPGAKVIVWAHNSHVGNAAATSMGWEGEFNIGELCRNAYGSDMAAIGFATDRGTVAAASAWDQPMEIMQVLPARADSHEHLFRRAGHARSLTDWRNRPDLRILLDEPRLERAIGVIYRPDTELSSHYFRAVLSEQFDALVWFETSRAVTPLASVAGMPLALSEPFTA
jgi:erythromycin esterase-like protein